MGRAAQSGAESNARFYTNGIYDVKFKASEVPPAAAVGYGLSMSWRRDAVGGKAGMLGFGIEVLRRRTAELLARAAIWFG